MMVTTLQIYKDDLRIIKEWCIKKGLTQKELIHRWVEVVKEKKQVEFYLSLSMPHNYHKPLENKKIEKNYNKNRFVQ